MATFLLIMLILSGFNWLYWLYSMAENCFEKELRAYTNTWISFVPMKEQELNPWLLGINHNNLSQFLYKASHLISMKSISCKEAAVIRYSDAINFYRVKIHHCHHCNFNTFSRRVWPSPRLFIIHLFLKDNAVLFESNLLWLSYQSIKFYQIFIKFFKRKKKWKIYENSILITASSTTVQFLSEVTVNLSSKNLQNMHPYF